MEASGHPPPRLGAPKAHAGSRGGAPSPQQGPRTAGRGRGSGTRAGPLRTVAAAGRRGADGGPGRPQPRPHRPPAPHLPAGPHGQGPALHQGLPGRCRPAANALTSATGAPRASIRHAVERRAPDGRAPGAGWGRELGDGWERSTRPRPRFLRSLRLNLRVWAAGDAQAGMPWCSRPGPLSVDSARVRWAGAAGSRPPT